jgi:hypothetical protein
MVLVDSESKEKCFMSVNRHGVYSDQFRAEAAAMVLELGKQQVEVCRAGCFEVSVVEVGQGLSFEG